MARLEEPGRLSDSIIWDIQKRYYAERGADVWSTSAIPSQMSSNAYVAWAYAQVIEGFIRDAKPLNIPINIVEVGAGSGRLAYLIIRNLLEIVVNPENPGFRYIATDFAENNVDAWQDYEALQPYINRGILVSATYDADDPASLDAAVLDGEDGKFSGPVVVIANYLVDTLRQDAFRVEGGKLQENRLAATASDGKTAEDTDVLRYVDLEQAPVEINGSYYNDDALDGVLDGYKQDLSDAHFMMPIGFIRCLQAFEEMSNGPVMVLVGDKGRRTDGDVSETPRPALVIHDNCFSFTANMNALGRFAVANGGRAYFSDDQDRGFIISSLVMGQNNQQFRSTGRAFEDAVGRMSPRDISNQLKIAAKLETVTLDEVLFWLKLGNYDTRILLDLRRQIVDCLVDRADETTPRQRRNLRIALRNVWDNHYPVGVSRDVPFAIAAIFEVLGDYETAALYYEESQKEWGEHASTYYRMARCWQRDGDRSKAREMANESLRLDPDSEQAARLLSELGG